ncbi:hypothetical protein CBM2599_A10314 [Cupriavidus taiwanensis]|nr:hypothetical protein CBM2599_A10314 [Cupriavidus taiwanensis]SOY80502.1 hypothetical protein CBM2600_A10159 [Cupriavidus taiwanensis]
MSANPHEWHQGVRHPAPLRSISLVYSVNDQIRRRKIFPTILCQCAYPDFFSYILLFYY